MAGGVTVFMPEDRGYQSESYLRSRMITGMGGRAAEQIVFHEVTSGAVSDLRQVTAIARAMVSQLGMSDAIGPLNYGDDERQPFLGYTLSQGRNYSEETAAKIDNEVRRLVEDAYAQTFRLLENNRDKLEALANALLEQEVIGQDEMYRVIGMEDKLAEMTENVFNTAGEEPAKMNGTSAHSKPNTGSPDGLILDLLEDIEERDHRLNPSSSTSGSGDDAPLSDDDMPHKPSGPVHPLDRQPDSE